MIKCQVYSVLFAVILARRTVLSDCPGDKFGYNKNPAIRPIYILEDGSPNPTWEADMVFSISQDAYRGIAKQISIADKTLLFRSNHYF